MILSSGKALSKMVCPDTTNNSSASNAQSRMQTTQEQSTEEL